MAKESNSHKGNSKFGRMIALITTVMVVATAAVFIGSLYSDNSSAAEFTDDVNQLKYTVINEPTETANGKVSVAAASTFTVTSVTIPDTVVNDEKTYDVTKIASSGFSSKTTLVSVYLGSNITTIDSSAFSGCTNLERIVPTGNVTTDKTIILPEGMQYILSNAFYNCSKIESVTLPTSIISLTSRMFDLCSNLREINYNCTQADYGGNETPISNVILRDRVINIGSSVKTIPAKLFKGFSGNYYLGESPELTTIGNYAFYGSNNTIRFDLPQTGSFTTLGSYAFENASFKDAEGNKGDVTIPASVSAVGAYSFRETSIGKLTINTNTIVQNIYSNPDEVVYGSNVSQINTGVIGSNTTQVTIGSAVTKIWDYAFAYTTNSSTYSPSGVTNVIIDNNSRFVVQNGALYDSGITKLYKVLGTGAVNIQVPDTVTKYEIYSFGNREISSVILSANADTIARGMFYRSTFLEGSTLSIPSSVTTIGESAFSYATFGMAFVMPSTVSSTGTSAFESATFSSGLTVDVNIGSSSFKNATIPSITINSQSIGANAFQNSSIGSLTFGNTVTSIGNYAFQNLTTVGYTIPSSVTSFGNYAFENTKVSSLSLPADVTIGNYAFSKTELTKLVIPATYTNIGQKAFYNCQLLAEIQFMGTPDASTIGTDAFDTQYSDNGDILSMKVKDSTGSLENETVNTLGKYGTTAVNSGHYEIDQDLNGTDGISWSYDHTNGVLTFTKNGETTAMTNYASNSNPKWQVLKKFTKEIIVDDTITSTNIKGLSDFPLCEKITIGSAVKTLGGAQNLYSLKEIVFRATSCSNVSSNEFLNCGINNNTGVKVTFQSAGGMTIPQYLFSGYNCNIGELVFDINGTINFGHSSMVGLKNVSKISYIHGSNFSGDYAGFNTDGAELGSDSPTLTMIIGEEMTSMPGTLHYSKFVTHVQILSSNITSIPNDAFKQCYRLVSITIPESVTSIGNNAFKECTNLTSIAIGDDCTTIGTSAFEGCVILTGFDLSHVTSIGNRAFYGCALFSGNQNLSAALTIGQYAFSGDDADGAPNLGDVSISATVNLGEAAFRYSGGSFGTVTVSPSVSWSGNGNYFQGCSVTAVIIDTSKQIPGRAFDGITTNFSLTLKTTPDLFAPADRTKITSAIIDSNFVWSGTSGTKPLSGPNGRIFAGTPITSLVINKTDMEIGQNAFYGCTSLTTITGFENIIRFYENSFNGCTLLFAEQDTVEFSGVLINSGAFSNTGLSGTVRLIGCTVGTGASTQMPFSGCAITALEFSGDPSVSIWKLMNGNTADYELTIVSGQIPDVSYVENFDGGLHITAVTIGALVTGSPDSARFTGCVNIASITYNATAFATDAFAENSPFNGLTQSIALILGDESDIPDNMFKGLNISGSLELKDGMTVGSYAFSGTSLTGATVRAGTVLGDYVFRDCTGLLSATVEYGVTIGTGTFYGCTNLATATLTGNFTTIPTETFDLCRSLNDFTIPATVTSIGQKAFYSCRSLEEIQLPAGLTTIGNQAFYDCSGLTSITIPLSVTSIGLNAFWECINLSTVDIEDWESPDASKNLTINNYAFSGTKIDELILPERTVYIGGYAFDRTKITEISIPANVTAIGGYAFNSTTLLTEVTLNSDISTATNAFRGAGSAEGFTIILSDDVTAISTGMFEYSKAKTVQSGTRTFTIGTSAFEGCTLISSIPEKASSIGENAFKGCTGLITAVIPSTVTAVGLHAFDNCTALSTIRTTGETYLSRYAFSGCTGIRLVMFSEGTTFYNNLGEVFNNWQFERTNGTIVGNSNGDYLAGKAFKYSSAMTLTECFTVSFDVGGLANPIDPQVMAETTVATCPTEGTVLPGLNTDLYSFDGNWYTDHVGGTVWNFDNVVPGNLVLIAGITGREFDVCFNSCGADTDTQDIFIRYGTPVGAITGIPDMTYTGFDFAGYFTAAEGGTMVVRADYTVVSGVIGWTEGGKWSNGNNGQNLYAHWVGHTYTLTVKDENGTAIGSATIAFRTSSISWVDKPALAGNSIEGLYTSDGYTSKVINADGSTVESVINWTDDTGAWHVASNCDVYLKWEPKKVRIILDPDGDVDVGLATATVGSSELTNYIGVEWTGHVLTGYYLVDDMIIDSSGKLCSDITDYTDAEGKWIYYDTDEITFTAGWRLVQYTVEYAGNGSTSGSIDPEDMIYGTSYSLPDSGFIRTNYTLVGWNTAANGLGDAYDLGGTVLNLSAEDGAVVTLYAQWQGTPYTVQFLSNGGTGTMTNQSIRYSETVNLTQNAFTKIGYKFREWSVNEGGSGDTYANGAQVTNLAAGGGSITLYAQWDPITYEISFVADPSAQGHMAHQQMTYDSAANLTANAYSMIGRTFVGWSQNQDGSGNQYTDGELVNNLTTVDGATVPLFAVWEVSTTAVTLNANGGIANGSATATYDSGTLTGYVGVTRTGYTLTGYFTASTGGTKIINADGTLVNENIEDHISESRWISLSSSLTLYAQWTANSYNISLVAGAEGTSGMATVIFGEDHFTIVTMPARNGYSIAGYTVLDDIIAFDDCIIYSANIAGYTSGGKWCKAEDTSIDVEWVTRAYTVQLRSNGGDSADTSVVIGYSSSVTSLPIAYPTRTGYYFIGYFSDPVNGTKVLRGSNDSGPVYNAEGWVSGGSWINYSETQILYAHWAADEVSMELYDGDTTTGYWRYVDYDSTTMKQGVVPSRTGYEIEGFYIDSTLQTKFVNADLSIVPNITGYSDSAGRCKADPNPVEDYKLYVKWTPIVSSIILDKNLGDANGSATATYDSGSIGNYVAAARIGYAVSGYFTSASGGEKIIDENGALCADTAYTDATGAWIGTDEEVTLYAQWIILPFTITFDSDGGSAVEPITRDYDSAIEAPANPSKNGYAFVSWSPAFPAKMPAQNMTLRAIWAILPVPSEDTSIVFSDDKADTVVIDTSVGAIADVLADTTKTEIKVAGEGWNMVIPKQIVSSANGPVSIGAKTLSAAEKDSLSAAVKEKIAGKTVYSLSLSDSNGAISFTGSKIKVSLPYSLKDGENASDVKVFYLDGNNVIQVDATYDSDLKCAVFETDHFSNWFVDVVPEESPSSGGGSNIGLIIGIIVAVVLLAGVGVFVFVKKSKKA